ncbi:MAG: putative PEP-CTERM system TPR-repeat lipoprotein [Oleiphilaceae bacterium]|jgi:putative PEP-CTERM system TPR-repeat lipoprotein
MERIMKKLCLALVCSSLLIISGCSEKSSDEYIALAETNIQQNNIPSAIIELKNAIGVDPQDPRSRFMLGNLYAERGSAAAAEKELIRALDLGYEPNEVLPVLANAYSLQFKHAEIIKLVDESRNLAPEVSTSLLLYKALAHFQLDETYKAKKAVADANEISSDSLYSKLGNAYVDFSNKQVDTSLEKIEEILREQPDFADAHLLKGQLTTVTKDTKGAVKSFEKYKELLPQTYQSRVFLANAYIKNKQFEEAEKEIDILLQFNPEQPFINQLKGAVRFQSQDFSNAKAYADKAIQNGSDGVPNKIIAGISAFKLGLYEQSYKHISSIKDKLPPQNPILKILAILELKLGITNQSGLTLTSLDGLTEDDIILLSAASSQLMRDGKFSLQKSILDKVDSIEFSDPLRIAQKGMLRLSLDDIDGLSDLEQALALEPAQNTANTALARAYIDNELYDKALELSITWIQQKPEQVNGYILAAISYLKLKETNQAENMFNQALIIDPNNIEANTYYADRAVAADDKKSAVAFLGKIIRANPSHIDSLRKYFILQRDLGVSEGGLKPIERAFNEAPDKLQFRLLYAKALFTQGQYTQSVAVLEQVIPSDVSPDNYWLALGNAYYANGQFEKAAEITEDWVSLQPNNKGAYLRLIALHDISKNYAQALLVANTAQQKFSKEEQFEMLVTFFSLVTGDVKAAELAFSKLTDETSESVAGQGLMGQILLEKGEAKSALPKLEAFYEQKSSRANASLVAKALKELKQYSEAISFLQGHELKMGKSTMSNSQIAELAIISNNYELASSQYIAILQVKPDNTRALNNLAYILIEQGNYQKALLYAKRAAELSPEYPAVLDTYGTTLFKTGQFDEAVKVFDKAYNFEKTDTQVALRYAEAMIAAKQTVKAEKILNEIISNDSDTQLQIQLLKSKI